MTEKTLGQIAYEKHRVRKGFACNWKNDSPKTWLMWESIAQAVIEARKWQPIATAPQDDCVSFLALLKGNECCKSLTLQVQKFEGRMYPDHLDFNVDDMDIVTGATHWQPLPEPPKQESES